MPYFCVGGMTIMGLTRETPRRKKRGEEPLWGTEFSPRENFSTEGFCTFDCIKKTIALYKKEKCG